MKRALTRGEKWLFASSILFISMVVGGAVWKNAQPAVINLDGNYFVKHLSYSPDGQRLVIAANTSINSAEFAQIYDLPTRSKICDLQVPPHKGLSLAYTSLAWSNDGQRIVAGYIDGTQGNKKFPSYPKDENGPRYNRVGKIALWDASSGVLTGNHLYATIDEDAVALSLRFSPDDKKLITDEQPPSIFDAASGRRLQVLKGTFPLSWKGALNEKLGLLAVLNKGFTQFQVYDTKAKRVVFQPPSGQFYGCWWQGTILGITTENSILFWDAQTRTSLLSPSLHQPDGPYRLAFNRDGETVVYSDGRHDPTLAVNSEIVAWDYRQNREAWRYPAPKYVGQIEWSPDGRWLAAVAHENERPMSLLVFDRNGHLRYEHGGSSNDFYWSPDSRHIATTVYGNNQPAQIEILTIGE